MKKSAFCFILIVLSFKNFAQDQLFKKDNTKLLVKVLEIGTAEIKYKMFDNLNGPSYVLNKNEVSIIIYENGKHEVIQSEKNINNSQYSSGAENESPDKYKKDSLLYYKYKQSFGINFLNFANNEFGFIYQREFFKKHLSLLIPFSIGIGNPGVTETAYFNQYNYYSSYNNSYLNLERKLFEIGLGLNYYSTLKYPVNYYLGPVLKFMQYSANQTYYYSGQGYNNNINLATTLNRFTASITNGLLFRTKTRLNFNVFASLGFSYDETTDKVIDPITKKEINPITKDVKFYFWSGACVSFCF